MPKRDIPQKTFGRMTFGTNPDIDFIIGGDQDPSPPAPAVEPSATPEPHAAAATRAPKPARAVASAPEPIAPAPPAAPSPARETPRPAYAPEWEQTSMKISKEVLNRFKNAVYARRLTLYEAVNAALLDQVERWEEEEGTAFPQRPMDHDKLPRGRRMR